MDVGHMSYAQAPSKNGTVYILINSNSYNDCTKISSLKRSFHG